jgi:high-affinity iron transporter
MGAGLITLREGFEASLIVGIVLACLARSGRRDAFAAVWLGVLAAVAVSVAVGVGLAVVGGELEGGAEVLFEGATMLAAASLLTWMIFWMRGQARTLRRDLEARVGSALSRGSTLALAAAVFVAVVREGVETALFLLGASESAERGVATVVGGLAGLAVAVALAFALFHGSRALDLGRFFTVTSALLLLVAAYLLASGLHELAEGGLLPDSEIVVAGAFLLLAVPTLVLYLRRPARPSADAA